MARNNRRRQNTTTRQSRTKRTSGRRRRRPIRNGVTPVRPQASAPLGKAIARGVRTILSYLPSSSVLSKMSDVIFSVLGIATSPTISDSQVKVPTKTVTLSGSCYGALASFMINYVNILSGSKLGSRESNTSTPSHMNFRYDFTEARLLSLSITIAPTNHVQKRSGTIYLAFVPVYNDTDIEMFKSSYKEKVDPYQLRRLPHCIMGPGTRPLTLFYRPKVSDGFIYHWHPLDTYFGMILIYYEDLARPTYSEITGEEFGVNCIIEGRVETRLPPAESYEGTIHEDLVLDLHRQSGSACHYIVNVNGKDYSAVSWLPGLNVKTNTLAIYSNKWSVTPTKNNVHFTGAFKVPTDTDDFVCVSGVSEMSIDS